MPVTLNAKYRLTSSVDFEQLRCEKLTVTVFDQRIYFNGLQFAKQILFDTCVWQISSYLFQFRSLIHLQNSFLNNPCQKKKRKKKRKEKKRKEKKRKEKKRKEKKRKEKKRKEKKRKEKKRKEKKRKRKEKNNLNLFD